MLTGQTSRDVNVKLKGGDLRVFWNSEDDHVYMTGEAKEVFAGNWLGEVKW